MLPSFTSTHKSSPILIRALFLKVIVGGRDQDGGVKGYGAHLPPQTHQKYIYMWNNSQRKSTENWQDLLYNQSCKKDPHITW